MQSLCQGRCLNAGETRLKYAVPPNCTVIQRGDSGRKKDKKRLTFLLSCSAKSAERYPLFSIRNDKKTRCFNKQLGAELGFGYTCNKGLERQRQSSLTGLNVWRHSLHARLEESTVVARHFSDHGSPECLPELFWVEVDFFPANTTLRTERMNDGSISTSKPQYRTL